MSADVEARLVSALRAVVPAPPATARARAAALAAVPPPGAGRGRWRTMTAGLLAAAAIGAGAGMAATGGFSDPPPAPSPEPALHVAAGTAAATAVVDGRAWVASAGGGLISRQATAVVLSPAGLFVAFGGRGSLVATELDGDERWSVPVAGTVVSIAWAPYPTYIAYVARRGGRYDLHVIWANGRNDRLAARDVLPLAPRWRADTSAIDYANADGSPGVWRHP